MMKSQGSSYKSAKSFIFSFARSLLREDAKTLFLFSFAGCVFVPTKTPAQLALGCRKLSRNSII